MCNLRIRKAYTDIVSIGAARYKSVVNANFHIEAYISWGYNSLYCLIQQVEHHIRHI